MLARELKAGGERFVVVERSAERIEEARALGYLCVHGDASDETTLQRAGIDRARVLATVLPDDAVNVLITLSARSLQINDDHRVRRIAIDGDQTVRRWRQ